MVKQDTVKTTTKVSAQQPKRRKKGRGRKASKRRKRNTASIMTREATRNIEVVFVILLGKALLSASRNKGGQQIIIG